MSQWKREGVQAALGAPRACRPPARPTSQPTSPRRHAHAPTPLSRRIRLIPFVNLTTSGNKGDTFKVLVDLASPFGERG